MEKKTSKSIYGLLAQFESAQEIYNASSKVQARGFKKWEAYSPIPVHGLDKVMALPPSPIPWLVLVLACIGGIGGFSLWTWMSVVDYPLLIAGKPFNSWQAHFIPAFECTVLLGAVGAFLGVFIMNKLPAWYHPLSHSEKFLKVTDDKFFIAIEATDPQFDINSTKKFLQDLGSSHVEVVEE